MTRNKQLLSDKENERMFADMVENVVKKRVDLRYTSKPIAKVESFGEYHAITLGKIKGIDRFTLLNHEAGHILFNSPTKTAEDMITEWAEGWKADAFIPLDTLKKVYWCALNLIEDQRIESLMAKLYLYNRKRFYKAKLNVGKEYATMSQNPIQTLDRLRFLRGDLVDDYYPNNPYGKFSKDMAVKVLSEVEGTGQRGALIGLAKFKPFIDKYIEYHIKHEIPIREDELTYSFTPLEYDEEGVVSISNLGSMKEARDSGEQDIEHIKNILSNVDINKMSSYDIIENDGNKHGNVGKPIQEIVNDMSKMFRNMNEMPRTTIGYEGDEIDIESYITNKAGKVRELDYCFRDTKYTQGISILVAVDGSSSMEDGSHSSMTRARNMVATMYKAIENMKNVNLMSIVWSSDLYGRMNVTRIKSLEDTRRIHTNVKYPTTPTHMAIEYSTKMMKRMKGRKKLLIFITDGQPEYMKGGTLLPTQTLVKMSINSMVRGMRRCDNMIVLLIKPSDFSQKCSEDIFGKRLIVADDMKSGSDIIMNKFKSLVVGVLK
jgi:Mg-chelatase subunit ChlD